MEQQCDQCGREFGFPLAKESRPREVNGKVVVGGLSRGFYGAVYVTQHPRTGDNYAAKVIPVATYAPKSAGGYEKDFQQEVAIHRELSRSPVVARITDWDSDDLDFGGVTIPCYWIEMEFVEGTTLSDLIDTGALTPRQVAQVAWDLLDVIEQLHQREKLHNDLHAKNIMVVHLDEADSRRVAIHPYTSMKVLDLGSAGSKTRSGPGRLGDLHWVSQHIRNLVDAYESQHPQADPQALRVCAQLRRVAEHYLGTTDELRAPMPSDMKQLVHDAYRYGQRPWMQSVRLTSISTHYNARTLPSWFASELLEDPDNSWASRLSGPGPLLLHGMRGCGKTILLRSLEWSARLHPRTDEGGDEESPQAALLRASREDFLGLFVSCSSLLRGSTPEPVPAPLRRTFLAFAREVVRDVEICDLKGVGEIDHQRLHDFASLIARTIPWFRTPTDYLDVWTLEKALSNALTDPANGHTSDSGFTPHVVFEELADVSRKLVDIWADRRLLFLLDDLSTRVLLQANVDELLSQLCLGSQHYGFKISTESQSIALRTSGGEFARGGRDFDPFDLGHDVYEQLRGRSGVAFVARILARRARVTDGVPSVPLAKVLGTQGSLKAVASAIRSGRRPYYWGVEALAGLCVGDIGDVLQLYDTILDKGADRGLPIPADVQERAAIELAESKLRSLILRDEWLYSHATAFAQAAHRELLASDPSRLRQHTQVHVTLPSSEHELFDLVRSLVDGGVYVFTGGTARQKTLGTQPVLQFKMAYRKLLGLPSGVPLSRRDRFELENLEDLTSWLAEPIPDKLKWGNLPASPDDEDDPAIPSVPEPPEVPTVEGRQLVLSPRPEDALPEPHSAATVITAESGTLDEFPLAVRDMHIVSAFGFEDRSPGMWKELLSVAKPRSVQMIAYPKIGHRKQIESMFKANKVHFDVTLTSAFEYGNLAEGVVSSAPTDSTFALDTTALTKSLIYQIVATALRHKSDIWVIHTCASTYHPTDDVLRPVVERLMKNELRFIKELDSLVEGEVEPFRTKNVGRVMRDVGHPTFLAVFIPIKHAKVASLIEDVSVEKIAAIVPLHSLGPNSPRTVAANYLADHYLQQFGGEKAVVGSLDHQLSYETLADLHSVYGLNLGYNFEVALTGTKMHTVGAGMLGAVTNLAAVYYSAPADFKESRFTEGTGEIRLSRLKRVPAQVSGDR